MRDKGVILAIAVFCVLSLFIGCSGSRNDVRQIFVTIMPQKYFAERIAGNLMTVNCAVPPGMSPESYDMSPASMVAISSSAAYFKVGTLGFETGCLPAIESNNPDMKIVDTSKGIEPIASGHDHGDASAAGYDPHVWTSPLAAKVMARNICDGLAEIDPENAATYESNYRTLAAEMDSIDTIVRERLRHAGGKMFAIYHPSLSYFARDYGLKQLSLESEGKEMTPLSMKNAIDTARANGVKSVFVQAEFNPDLVKGFASEIGAEVIVINPLAYEWGTEIMKIVDAID